MKFLHTSDWQVGMKAAHAGAVSALVREARIESAARVIEVARHNGAEFILIAGDTFENNGVDRAIVQKIGDILGRFERPVYMLPGNHDPLEIGSVWEHPVWASHARVLVLREPRAVEVPSGLLYPCPVLDAHSRSDLTAWMPAGDTGRIRIGVAHGTVEGSPVIEPSLPIPRSAAARAHLDYLALGHWHSTTTYEDPDGTVRMAYSGTHETSSFGERNSGNVLLIEIPERGAKPLVKVISTGSLSWETRDARVIERGQLTELRRQIEAISLSRPTLIEVRLGGLLFAEDTVEVARIEQILSARFLHGRVDVSALAPAPSDEDWVSSLPLGFLREAAAKLRQTANSDGDVKRRLIAARALRELYVLKQEAQL